MWCFSQFTEEKTDQLKRDIKQFPQDHTASGRNPTCTSRQTTSRIQICKHCQFSSWLKIIQYLPIFDRINFTVFTGQKSPLLLWPLHRLSDVYRSDPSNSSHIEISVIVLTQLYQDTMYIYFSSWKDVYCNLCIHLTGGSIAVL